MIKNIIFDFGNVVIEWNPDKIVRTFATDLEEQKILKNTIFESKEWTQIDSGEITHNEATTIFMQRVPIQLEDKVRQMMDNWYYHMSFNKDIHELIEKLKKQDYKIFALSNCGEDFYEYVSSSEVGKYFDGFLISALEKTVKPNKEIYERLLQKFNLKAEECFFIDDRKENILGANECGIEGHVFDSNKFDELLEDLKQHNVNI